MATEYDGYAAAAAAVAAAAAAAPPRPQQNWCRVPPARQKESDFLDLFRRFDDFVRFQAFSNVLGPQPSYPMLGYTFSIQVN